MGRTKRKRQRRKDQNCNPTLNHETTIINLQKWLIKNGWNNHHQLELRDFTTTGRGLSSQQFSPKNCNLITMPYHLMITLTTLQPLIKSLPRKVKLTIHDLLTLFLALEKLKGETSHWKCYLASLPEDPPFVPWIHPEQYLPRNLKLISNNLQENLEESLQRVKSIQLENRVPTSIFKWAYIMVNTRAVYVDPQVIQKLTNDSQVLEVLLDSPNMALCPFLDMFNHHYSAGTETCLRKINNEWCYQLSTLTPASRNEQIFISYGNHDNAKLLLEYGFFIVDNPFDCITFDQAVLGLRLDDRQYRFVREHELGGELFVAASRMVSFNLKALLFVAWHGEVQNFNQAIYGQVYGDEFLQKVRDSVTILLDGKLQGALADLTEATKSGHLLIADYIRNQIELIKKLRENMTA